MAKTRPVHPRESLGGWLLAAACAVFQSPVQPGGGSSGDLGAAFATPAGRPMAPLSRRATMMRRPYLLITRSSLLGVGCRPGSLILICRSHVSSDHGSMPKVAKMRAKGSREVSRFPGHIWGKGTGAVSQPTSRPCMSHGGVRCDRARGTRMEARTCVVG